jgi:hypothetical protein
METRKRRHAIPFGMLGMFVLIALIESTLSTSGKFANDSAETWRIKGNEARRTASNSVEQRRTASNSVEQRRTASNSVEQRRTASNSVEQRRTAISSFSATA